MGFATTESIIDGYKIYRESQSKVGVDAEGIINEIRGLIPEVQIDNLEEAYNALVYPTKEQLSDIAEGLAKQVLNNLFSKTNERGEAKTIYHDLSQSDIDKILHSKNAIQDYKSKVIGDVFEEVLPAAANFADGAIKEIIKDLGAATISSTGENLTKEDSEVAFSEKRQQKADVTIELQTGKTILASLKNWQSRGSGDFGSVNFITGFARTDSYLNGGKIPSVFAFLDTYYGNQTGLGDVDKVAKACIFSDIVVGLSQKSDIGAANTFIVNDKSKPHIYVYSMRNLFNNYMNNTDVYPRNYNTIVSGLQAQVKAVNYKTKSGNDATTLITNIRKDAKGKRATYTNIGTKKEEFKYLNKEYKKAKNKTIQDILRGDLNFNNRDFAGILNYRTTIKFSDLGLKLD